MDKIKLGLQIYSVREAFAEDPQDTLSRIAKMGYDGVELVDTCLQETPETYAAALKKSGLECLSCMLASRNLQGEALENAIQTYKTLNISNTVIGSVGAALETPPEALELILQACARLQQEGFRCGYHNHDTDSVRLSDGRSFFEYVLDNTPADFSMVIDTGNTMGGGDDPIALLQKYPGRTPVLHLKGYGSAQGYITPVWDSELDMEKLLTLALDTCGTKTIIVEFGKRGDYEPFDWAEKSLVWLKQLLHKMERI